MTQFSRDATVFWCPGPDSQRAQKKNILILFFRNSMHSNSRGRIEQKKIPSKKACNSTMVHGVIPDNSQLGPAM